MDNNSESKDTSSPMLAPSYDEQYQEQYYYYQSSSSVTTLSASHHPPSNTLNRDLIPSKPKGSAAQLSGGAQKWGKLAAEGVAALYRAGPVVCISSNKQRIPIHESGAEDLFRSSASSKNLECDIDNENDNSSGDNWHTDISIILSEWLHMIETLK